MDSGPTEVNGKTPSISPSISRAAELSMLTLTLKILSMVWFQGLELRLVMYPDKWVAKILLHVFCRTIKMFYPQTFIVYKEVMISSVMWLTVRF